MDMDEMVRDTTGEQARALAKALFAPMTDKTNLRGQGHQTGTTPIYAELQLISEVNEAVMEAT